MPTLRKSNPIALLCSDIHLSLNPPVARAEEPDWFEAMKRPLIELSNLAVKYKVPIICAGDIFDRWNSPPELINFALEYLPDNMLTIPGQHDLPMHNIALLKKSAYYTLIKSHKIIPLTTYINRSNIVFYPFIYGSPIEPNIDNNKDKLSIAVIHEYIYIPETKYPDAPKSGDVLKNIFRYKGYDVVIAGDNHKGFKVDLGNGTIFNCGTLMRRKSDEIDYKPQIGLLYESGEVEIHYLDTSKDIISSTKKEEASPIELKDFLKELNQLQNTSLDFIEVMKMTLKNKSISEEVKEILIEIIDSKK